MSFSFDRLPFTRAKLPVRVVASYTFDYIIIIALFLIFWVIERLEPFHQHFALQNYTLQYPYAVHETIPVPVLFVCAVAAPALIITAWCLGIDGLFAHLSGRSERGWRGHSLKERLWEVNCGLLGLLLSSALAFCVTAALKNATGKPRPDFIDRCQPRQGSVDPTPYGLSDSSICTQTDAHIMKDGFRSFPSGHSSTAFAGLFFLSLFLAGRLHIMDQRGEVWKTFVVLVPSLSAALIAISRIEDARHHPFDVISGSLLGILVAWISYRQYFPSLTSPELKGRAYPIRTWATDRDERSRSGQALSTARDAAGRVQFYMDDSGEEHERVYTRDGERTARNMLGAPSVNRDRSFNSTTPLTSSARHERNESDVAELDEEAMVGSGSSRYG